MMNIRILTGKLHLLERFLTDDRLVQTHVVEHAAQRVAASSCLMQSSSARRSRSPAAGCVRVLGEDLRADLGAL